MFIYNCSFIIDSSLADSFLRRLRDGHLLRLAAAPDSGAGPLDIRLSRLRAVVGDPGALRDAATFPLEARFESVADARRWAKAALDPVIDDLSGTFGRDRLLSVCTILETL